MSDSAHRLIIGALTGLSFFIWVRTVVSNLSYFTNEPQSVLPQTTSSVQL